MYFLTFFSEFCSLVSIREGRDIGATLGQRRRIRFLNVLPSLTTCLSTKANNFFKQFFGVIYVLNYYPIFQNVPKSFKMFYFNPYVLSSCKKRVPTINFQIRVTPLPIVTCWCFFFFFFFFFFYFPLYIHIHIYIYIYIY